MTFVFNAILYNVTRYRQGLKENKKIQCKAAQTAFNEGDNMQEETDLENILQNVDLLGIADWDPSIQQEVHNLICEYACIFL